MTGFNQLSSTSRVSTPVACSKITGSSSISNGRCSFRHGKRLITGVECLHRAHEAIERLLAVAHGNGAGHHQDLRTGRETRHVETNVYSRRAGIRVGDGIRC